MIGLGSNRLSVCRRGGMRVTQAGKGGMEWLAGYRDPIWASPYSAQATAALKAQFPTQWPTIRDYGFAHPALVPFINEDPMMVCSLGLQSQGVDLPIRWLVSQGGANYCDLGVTPNQDSYAHLIFEKEGSGGAGGGSFGARQSASSRAFGLTHPTETGLNHFYGDGYTAHNNVQVDRHFDIVFDKNKLYLGGILLSTRTYMTFTCPGTALVFAIRNGSSLLTSDNPQRFCVIELDGHIFVPYKHKTGENMYSIELLDITDMSVCTRVGTLTIAYTRNGQPWTPAS